MQLSLVWLRIRSSSPREGCFTEYIFNETAMHARAQASNRPARANRASHGPRVRAKGRRRTRENLKDFPKGTKSAKGSHKGKTSKNWSLRS